MQGLSCHVDQGESTWPAHPWTLQRGPLAFIYSGPVSQPCFPDPRGTGLAHSPSSGHSHRLCFSSTRWCVLLCKRPTHRTGHRPPREEGPGVVTWASGKGRRFLQESGGLSAVSQPRFRLSPQLSSGFCLRRTRRPPSPATACGKRWASSSPLDTAGSCASAPSSTSSWAS